MRPGFERWCRFIPVAALILVASSCRPDSADCPRCGTVVVAATGEPSQLLPPLVVETVGRDISDQVYQRLADLAPGAAPIDTAAYRPALADRWERVDSLAWWFHLRPGADGRTDARSPPRTCDSPSRRSRTRCSTPPHARTWPIGSA